MNLRDANTVRRFAGKRGMHARYHGEAATSMMLSHNETAWDLCEVGRDAGGWWARLPGAPVAVHGPDLRCAIRRALVKRASNPANILSAFLL